jgi:HSP20 family molecular chaperone IbpA
MSETPRKRKLARSPEQRPPARAAGPGWEVPGGWTFPSARDIEERFEELLRHRWREPPSGGETEWLLLGRDVQIEMDLPGVGEQRVRARLEVRVEAGSLRVRIRSEPESS